MGLLVFIIIRILRGARIARDPFGAMLCYGVAILMAFQSLVNIAVNLNLIPVTGLPLALYQLWWFRSGDANGRYWIGRKCHFEA